MLSLFKGPLCFFLQFPHPVSTDRKGPASKKQFPYHPIPCLSHTCFPPLPDVKGYLLQTITRCQSLLHGHSLVPVATKSRETMPATPCPHQTLSLTSLGSALSDRPGWIGKDGVRCCTAVLLPSVTREAALQLWSEPSSQPHPQSRLLQGAESHGARCCFQNKRAVQNLASEWRICSADLPLCHR